MAVDNPSWRKGDGSMYGRTAIEAVERIIRPGCSDIEWVPKGEFTSNGPDGTVMQIKVVAGQVSSIVYSSKDSTE